MENIQTILVAVMVKLKQQFNVPATFTYKEKKEGFGDVHIFLHGVRTSHLSSVDYLLSLAKEDSEEHQKVNAISDELIYFFIDGMKEEEEHEAIDEVIYNLGYLYEHATSAVRWFDTNNEQYKVTVHMLNKDEELLVTMSSSQMKQEYIGRFDSEDAPDILVDLSKLFTIYKNEGSAAAIEFANVLNRNITARLSNGEDDLHSTLKNLAFTI